MTILCVYDKSDGNMTESCEFKFENSLKGKISGKLKDCVLK